MLLLSLLVSEGPRPALPWSSARSRHCVGQGIRSPP